MSEVPIQEPSDVNYSHEDYSDDSYQEDRGDRVTSKGFRTNLIVSQRENFKMNENIYGVVNISKETDNNEKNTMKTEEFQITLNSKVLNADELQQILR